MWDQPSEVWDEALGVEVYDDWEVLPPSEKWDVDTEVCELNCMLCLSRTGCLKLNAYVHYGMLTVHRKYLHFTCCILYKIEMCKINLFFL